LIIFSDKHLLSLILLLFLLNINSSFCQASEDFEFEIDPSWKAPKQEEAKKWAGKIIPMVKSVRKETRLERRNRLKKSGKIPRLDDLKNRYFYMDSPIIKKTEDSYLPVRFMHAKHAVLVNDCFTCHHYRPDNPKAKETTRCSACHQDSFNSKFPDRTGLKAAYHRQCIDCHREKKKGPVDCLGCHEKNAPLHKDLIRVEEDPDPEDVTIDCLRCHDQQAEELLSSSHWLWKGPSPFTEGHEKKINSGKATNTINNFCIHIGSNWRQCTSCHVGYGWIDNDFDFTDKTKMDCLVCHDTTGTYFKGQSLAGFPDEDVDLKFVAENVGKSGRKNCGDCHFAGGGGDSVKHGDMSSALYYPSQDIDVHMGGYDFQCRDCHKTRQHDIQGVCSIPNTLEGSRSCETCHTSSPHLSGELLNYHLNSHSRAISCTTCHIPIYASNNATKTQWDWSKSGDKNRQPKNDSLGKKDYSVAKGEFLWGKGVKPDYAWFNGKMYRHYLGDSVNEDITSISRPVGHISNPAAKIFPFKRMSGKQAADKKYNYFLVGHVYGPGGFMMTMDWDKSFREGMEAVNLKFSGKYKWVKTEMYLGLNHEIPPKEMALSCVQCHSSLKEKQTCDRCHQDNRNIDFKKLANKNIAAKRKFYKERNILELVDETDYLNFKQLGYKGDPIEKGGRFKKLPLGYKKK
jgi:octaheme c-type cytochrome (tetrathionate reductase family)